MPTTTPSQCATFAQPGHASSRGPGAATCSRSPASRSWSWAALISLVVVRSATWRAAAGGAAYTALRHNLGRTILLGLEVLIVADIILTVAIDQTLESAATLGLIVLVRTFLSFSLDIEMDGVRALAAARDGAPAEPRRRPTESTSPDRDRARARGGPGSGAVAPERWLSCPTGVVGLGLGGGFLDRAGGRVVDGDGLDLLGAGHLGLDGRGVRRGHEGQDPGRARGDDAGELLLDIEPMREVARLAGGGAGDAQGRPRRRRWSRAGRPRRRRRRRSPT